ncbi:MAG: hypothetical protein ABII06_17840, partial [Pseudomonadota bacterium]
MGNFLNQQPFLDLFSDILGFFARNCCTTSRTTMIIMVLVFLPATGWSANLHYALDVQINIEEKIITGSARINTDTHNSIGLSVQNLHNLKVDGKD